MTENNNSGFNKDEIVRIFSDAADKAVKTAKETGNSVLNMLEAEKKKAEIRSEIGHTSRELAKQYEKLGRMYYNSREFGSAAEGEKDLLDLIRANEKCVELLNEKLDQLG